MVSGRSTMVGAAMPTIAVATTIAVAAAFSMSGGS
jgi:hypothetical protein